tara:strand:- start:824 stop:1018 length:195 start_codon:yes stop_codon:yes gene_type:complete
MSALQLKLQGYELKSLEGQLIYVNTCLRQPDIAKWETVEFQQVKDGLIKSISDTKALIETIKEL